MNKKNWIWATVCFAIILTIHLVHLIIHRTSLIGKESFYYINDALQEAGNNWYSWFLMSSTGQLQVETTSFIVLILSGMLSFILFMLLLEKLEENEKIKQLSMFFLLASPLFIYNISVSQPFAILSVLFIATIYFLMFENFLKYLSIPTSALVAFLDPGVFIFFILPLLFYILIKKKNSLLIGAVSLISLIITSLRIETLHMKDVAFSLSHFLEENISMFGALKGFTFISCLLVLIAFIYTWKKKKEFLPIYAMVVLALFSSFYIEDSYKILLNFLLAYASAYGLYKLMHIRWELLLIKKLIVIIVITGIVISGIFYVNFLYSKSPSQDMVGALNFIRGNSLEHETVLSDNEKREWIIYFADRKFCCYNETKDIFKTRNNEVAVNFMEYNNVSFILVDDTTKKLMEREGGSQGLEFIMENSNNFRKMKDYEEIDVWAFRR